MGTEENKLKADKLDECYNFIKNNLNAEEISNTYSNSHFDEINGLIDDCCCLLVELSNHVKGEY